VSVKGVYPKGGTNCDASRRDGGDRGGRCCCAYLYVCLSICSWSLTLYKYKRRTAKPSLLGSKKPWFRFSTVLTKNRGFQFRFGNRHCTTVDMTLISSFYALVGPVIFIAVLLCTHVQFFYNRVSSDTR